MSDLRTDRRAQAARARRDQPRTTILDLQVVVVLEVRKSGLFGIETGDLRVAVAGHVGAACPSSRFRFVLLALRMTRQIGRRHGVRDGRPIDIWYPTSGRPLRRRRHAASAVPAPVAI